MSEPMKVVEERRLGRFNVPRIYIAKFPEDVMEVLSKCLIVRAETLYHADAIEYIAFSEMFEPCEDGCEPPMYVADMEQTMDQETGDILCKFIGFKNRN